ncbi:MAG: zinc ribbon domain-containing protein [Candidatus Lokiarchaeota archaeon]|nr:zinc ribbon domain-containing protein [Candidatus Lokiarchaeota archaeon]
MFYCQNCGAKIESTEKFCSFCGFSFQEKTEPNDKDARITELEQKIARLEQKDQRIVKKASTSAFSPWMAIVPVAFVAAFFGFFILLIWVIRQ